LQQVKNSLKKTKDLVKLVIFHLSKSLDPLKGDASTHPPVLEVSKNTAVVE